MTKTKKPTARQVERVLGSVATAIAAARPSGWKHRGSATARARGFHDAIEHLTPEEKGAAYAEGYRVGSWMREQAGGAS